MTAPKKNAPDKILAASIPAVFLAFTFCVFGPLEIYMTNVTELWFPMSAILLPSILAGAICCGILVLIGISIPSGVREWYSCFLTGLGLALYIQGNFIHVDYGVLDGRDIRWEDHTGVAIWDTAIWAVCLAAPFIARKLTKDKSRSAASIVLCCIMLVEAITLGTLALTTDFSKSDGANGAYLSSKDLYQVSAENNVIVFVLDTFDQQYMDEILLEQPDILDTWDGFVQYTNTTCAYPTTKGSLPFLLTGQYYKNEQPYDDYVEAAYQSTDFYETLHDAGYEIGLYTSDLFVSSDMKDAYLRNGETSQVSVNSYVGLEGSMLRFTAFRYFPHIAKRFVWFYSGVFDQYKGSATGAPPYSSDNISFYSGLKTNGLQTVTDSKVYSFIHLDGTHPPLTLNEDVTVAETGKATPITQGIACLNIVREYIAQLKELGVYDDTMLIVTADHGSAPRRWPIFLLKGLGSSGPVETSNAPISHENLLPTVMEGCGLNDGRRYGEPVDAVSDTAERKYFHYNWDDSWNKSYLPDIAEYTVDPQKHLVQTGTMYTSRGMEKVEPYRYDIGQDIKFTIADDGCRYFTQGISVVETDFAWSLGTDGRMLLHVGEGTGDLAAEFRFKFIYSAPQTLTIRCGGSTLYDAQVNSEEEIVRFTVPESCIQNGLLTLDLGYPDAVAPDESNGGNGQRILAFAFQNIRFDPVG